MRGRDSSASAGGIKFVAAPVADFLESQAAMLRVGFHQGKLLIGAAADVQRKRVIVLPETEVALCSSSRVSKAAEYDRFSHPPRRG